MKTKKSELKTNFLGYNNMPSRKNVEERINDLLSGNFKYVDIIDKKYWENREDTVVIEIDVNLIYRCGEKEVMKFGEAMANIATNLICDELQTERKAGKMIVRIWWD